MSLLPAHPRRNGGADDERPTGEARADGARPATGAPLGETGETGQTGQTGQTGPSAVGRSPERPRYAFAYAPADDAPDAGPPDAGPRDGNPSDRDARDRDRAGNDTPGRTVVAGNVVSADPADERGGDEDPADERGGDEPAVTGPDPVPGRAGPSFMGKPAAPAAPAPAAPASATSVPPTVPVPTVAPPTVETPAAGMNRSAPGGDGTPVPAPRAATEREPAAAAAGDTTGAAGLDEPLLADAAALRDRWQRAQSDFVDDPRAAVADAAALVAQTAQAMIDALEQRQRLLRQEWERGQQRERGRGNGRGNDSVAGDPGDTERLRLTMRAYRALFNQICAR